MYKDMKRFLYMQQMRVRSPLGIAKRSKPLKGSVRTHPLEQRILRMTAYKQNPLNLVLKLNEDSLWTN